MLNQRKYLELGLLILVAPAGHTNTDAAWNVYDADASDELVQLGVNTDILCAHDLRGERTNDTDGARFLKETLCKFLCICTV